MSILKVVRCPSCGRRKLLRQRCDCGGRTPERTAEPAALAMLLGAAWVAGFTLLLLTIALTIASTVSSGWATGVMWGIFMITVVIQRAYNFEDGIEVQNTMLPPPLRWLTKIEMFINFWHQDRPVWRAFYLSNPLALLTWLFLGRDLVN